MLLVPCGASAGLTASPCSFRLLSPQVSPAGSSSSSSSVSPHALHAAGGHYQQQHLPRSCVPSPRPSSLPSPRRASLPSLLSAPRQVLPVRRHAIECSQYKGKFPRNPPPPPPPPHIPPSSLPPESLLAILANTRTLLPLALAVAVPLISGSIVALVASPLQAWYADLQRPWFQPPDFIFGMMWSLLYPVMGVASFLVWREGGWAAQRGPLVLYGVQLLVNLAWPVVFFKMHRIGAALGVISLLLLLVSLTLLSFASINPLAAALFLPYTLWVAFATVLNLALWNRNQGNTPGRGRGGDEDGDGGQGVSVKAERSRWGSIVVSSALAFLFGSPAPAIAATATAASSDFPGRQWRLERQQQQQQQQRMVMRQSEYKGFSLGGLNIAPAGPVAPVERSTIGTGSNLACDCAAELAKIAGATAVAGTRSGAVPSASVDGRGV
ncbi:hypothetical protein CLOP_g4339 [Closterium sp. NIES-67]|nr:hypothetical protein CLOP_g4339 [Closterium sp. NIES-67]